MPVKKSQMVDSATRNAIWEHDSGWRAELFVYWRNMTQLNSTWIPKRIYISQSCARVQRVPQTISPKIREWKSKRLFWGRFGVGYLKVHLPMVFPHFSTNVYLSKGVIFTAGGIYLAEEQHLDLIKLFKISWVFRLELQCSAK